MQRVLCILYAKYFKKGVFSFNTKHLAYVFPSQGSVLSLLVSLSKLRS